MSAVKKPRMRKCKAKGCDNMFTPFSSMEQWCSADCGYVLLQEKLAKKDAKAKLAKKKERLAIKKQHRQDKKKFRESDKEWCRAEAKKELHRWIQYVRDVDQPCISCGTRNPSIKYDAGHFRSVGSAKELEMEPKNIHKQCSVNCNQHLSSNRAGYEPGLVERYDQEYVDWLKGPHPAKHYKAHDYLEIRDKYRELNRKAGVLAYQKRKD